MINVEFHHNRYCALVSKPIVFSWQMMSNPLGSTSFRAQQADRAAAAGPPPQQTNRAADAGPPPQQTNRAADAGPPPQQTDRAAAAILDILQNTHLKVRNFSL